VEQNGRQGANGSVSRAIDGASLAHDAQRAWREAQGTTPLGPFEYVPPMGFREYWYPGDLVTFQTGRLRYDLPKS